MISAREKFKYGSTDSAEEKHTSSRDKKQSPKIKNLNNQNKKENENLIIREKKKIDSPTREKKKITVETRKQSQKIKNSKPNIKNNLSVQKKKKRKKEKKMIYQEKIVKVIMLIITKTLTVAAIEIYINKILYFY